MGFRAGKGVQGKMGAEEWILVYLGNTQKLQLRPCGGKSLRIRSEMIGSAQCKAPLPGQGGWISFTNQWGAIDVST